MIRIKWRIGKWKRTWSHDRDERKEAMTQYRMMTNWWVTGAASAFLALTAAAQDSTPELQQKLAAFKEAVAQNRAALQQYSWIQKTQLSFKGEVKNTKIESCHYGPDGRVQKTQVSEPVEPKKRRGIKGKVAAGKIEDVKDYMERTTSLIERYVPPSPERLKSVANQGNASFRKTGLDTIELQFRDYVKKGDTVTFGLDMAAQRIAQLNINTYLADEDKDPISLAVTFQTLPDTTNYPASKVLNVTAKQIVVKADSSNYQKLAN